MPFPALSQGPKQIYCKKNKEGGKISFIPKKYILWAIKTTYSSNLSYLHNGIQSMSSYGPPHHSHLPAQQSRVRKYKKQHRWVEIRWSFMKGEKKCKGCIWKQREAEVILCFLSASEVQLLLRKEGLKKHSSFSGRQILGQQKAPQLLLLSRMPKKYWISLWSVLVGCPGNILIISCPPQPPCYASTAQHQPKCCCDIKTVLATSQSTVLYGQPVQLTATRRKELAAVSMTFLTQLFKKTVFLHSTQNIPGIIQKKNEMHLRSAEVR